MEQDLQWFREARAAVAEAEERLTTLRGPTTASLSYIGRCQGSPGNPTATRGIAARAIERQVLRDRHVAETLERWRMRLHRDDRILLSLRYGMDQEEPRSLEAAAQGARIPCATPEERRAVEEHIDALLWRAALALRYRWGRRAESLRCARPQATENAADSA